MSKPAKKSTDHSETHNQAAKRASQLFASSGLQAIAVVILVIAAGAFLLPRIFAAEAEPAYEVRNLTATPTNTSAYGVNLAWNGTTPDHYRIEVINGTNVEKIQNSRDKSGVVNNLNCNVGSYKFRVYPARNNENQAGGAASATAKAGCPAVNFNAYGASGTTLTAQWSNANFATGYLFSYRAGNGGYTIKDVGGATSFTMTGSCGTTYSAYVTPKAGQTGPASGVRTATTAACPRPATGTSSSSAAAPKVVTTPKSSTQSAASVIPGPSAPATVAAPENFTAIVNSNKVVELSWDSVDGASKYLLSRSTDQQTWEQISETDETSYVDESTDFETTYYYQLQAMSEAGTMSSMVNVQVSTEAFEASSNKITSDDKRVTVTVPDGAIDGEYSCSVSSDENTAGIPATLSSVLGPYDLLCVSGDGDVINEFNKPLNVSIALKESADGYKDLSVQQSSGESWKRITNFKYDQNKQTISFELVKAESFGIFGVKQSSPIGWILLILFILLLIGLGIFVFLRRRRNRQDDYGPYVPAVPTSMTDVSDASQPEILAPAPNPEEEFRQAVAQPDCSHLDQAQQVIPTSQGCQECEQQGTHWKSLRICLICGHVGCSDDSDQQHALKHYQETGHPLIYEYGNPTGNTIGWCYIDQTYI